MIAPGAAYKWNQFVIQDKLPDAKTGGANANVDFLTATAWVDGRDDPFVLTVPQQVSTGLFEWGKGIGEREGSGRLASCSFV